MEKLEIIRCGNCAYWIPETVEEGDSCGRCRNLYSICNGSTTDDTWFCADAEEGGERDEE